MGHRPQPVLATGLDDQSVNQQDLVIYASLSVGEEMRVVTEKIVAAS